MIEPGAFVFFTSLVACIPAGTIYKQIEDLHTKRSFGTGIGLLIVLATCAPYIYYLVIMAWGNIMIIKFCQPRRVHVISLAFTWLLLFYIHYQTELAECSRWVFQNLALRFVGLAFEIYIEDKSTKRTEHAVDSSGNNPIFKLSSTQILHYVCFFVGIHKGPYFTWKTYKDHFNCPMNNLGDFRKVTDYKMKKAILISIIFTALRSRYPLNVYGKEEFYTDYGTDYRFLSCLPQLVMHYLEFQIIMLLSTSACCEAGFGVYPARCLAAPGGGPTVAMNIAEEVDIEKEEYNFSMLRCFDTEKLLMGPRMKDTIRSWDMSVQYWYKTYIMRNFITSNFEVRSAASFLLWAIWAGPTVQNAIISSTIWVHINLEWEYNLLYAESLKDPWEFGLTIMRMLCLFYLTPCFVIPDKNLTLRYYKSIYWIFHIILVILTIADLAIHKMRRDRLERIAKPTIPSKAEVTKLSTKEKSGTSIIKRVPSSTPEPTRNKSTPDNPDSKPSTSGNTAKDNNNNEKKSK